jgi:hypothetical protein
MSSLDDHPTVRRLRAGGAQESTVEQNPLNSGSLRRIADETSSLGVIDHTPRSCRLL